MRQKTERIAAPSGGIWRQIAALAKRLSSAMSAGGSKGRKAAQRRTRSPYPSPEPTLRPSTGDDLSAFLARDLPSYLGLSAECVTLIASSLIDCPIWDYKRGRFPAGGQFGRFFLLTEDNGPRKLWPTLRAVVETGERSYVSADLPSDAWVSRVF